MITGKFTMFTGPTGAGKSSLLCTMYNDVRLKGGKSMAVKHSANSGKSDHIFSSDGKLRVPCQVIATLDDIPENKFNEVTDVFIDDMQFFVDYYSIDVISELLLDGINVYGYGVDMDPEGDVYALMGDFLALADKVVKLRALCYNCGEDAKYSVLAADGFRACCSKCFSDFAVENLEAHFKEAVKIMGKQHPLYPNVSIIDEGMYAVHIKDEEEGFEVNMMVSDEALASIGWSLEEVAGIVELPTVYRFLDELGVTDNG